MNDAPAQREDQSIWARLRRRKVVQWSVAYVAAAWALLQGLEFLAGIYDWPTAFLRVVTLALALGVPIVVTLAWYHGDRGDQRVGGTELSIVAVLFLLGGGVVWYYQRTADTTRTPPSALTLEKTIPTDASIAVLPFVNMSSDKEQEYFADGISEELLNLLAKVPELRVIARTSSFSFKSKDLDIGEIARRPNVANVLEGSVRKSGDTLRITAQLVRASDSSHLWSQTYDRPMTDVFKVQDEIAAAVVEELKIKLLGATPKAKTTDPRAYALFLKAREISRQFTAGALEQSIALYKESLAIDPLYAPAWDGLAIVYESQVGADLRLADEGIRLALEATTQALALDPNYAPSHASLAWIALKFDRDLAAAARHLERALALDAANPDIIATAAVLARRLGRLDQAISIGEYLVARDPVNADTHADLAHAYRYAGRLDDAIAVSRTVLSLRPGYLWKHRTLGEMLLQKGDPEAALAEMQQESGEPPRLAGLSMVYHALGRRAESDAALAEIIKKYEKASANSIAMVFAFRGEPDHAFEWLNKAVQYNDTDLGGAAVHPMFANIHDDPRWLPFLRRIGMAPEQLAAIKFDVKVPN